MQKIIFISGVPGTGKTTLAYKMALKHKIDKIVSLDLLKVTLKTFYDDKYINTTTHEAYKLENLDVIEGFLKHCNVVNNYYEKIIKNIKDKTIIVEGATITQDFINKFNEYDCRNINLYVKNKDSLIKRYKKKMKQRKSNWIDNINEIMKINQYLKDSLKNNIEMEEGIIDESIFK